MSERKNGGVPGRNAVILKKLNRALSRYPELPLGSFVRLRPAMLIGSAACWMKTRG